MNSYIDQVLGKDENVLYQAQVALASFWVRFGFGGLCVLLTLVNAASSTIGEHPIGLAIFWFVLAGLFLIPPFVFKLTTELAITDRRVIAKFGLLSRKSIELNLSKIESIKVEQGIIGRIFNYGDIFIVGTGGSNEPIPRIANPIEFRRRFGEILNPSQVVSNDK